MRKVYLLIVLLLSAFISHAQYTATRTICSGFSFSFSDGVTFPGGSYTWAMPTSPDLFTGGSPNLVTARGVISQTLANPNVFPIIVTYSGTETNTLTPITLRVTVNPTPTVNAISTEYELNGTSTNGTIFSGTVAGTTYNWTNNNTSIVSSPATGVNNFPASLATNTTSSPITDNLSVVPSANGCTGSSRSFTIIVDPTKINVCTGTNINFNDPNVFPSGNFSWLAPTGGMGGGPGSGAIINQTLINNTNGPKVATYAVTEINSTKSFTLTIIVNPTPTIDAISNQVVCNGTTTSAVIFNSAFN